MEEKGSNMDVGLFLLFFFHFSSIIMNNPLCFTHLGDLVGYSCGARFLVLWFVWFLLFRD